MTFLDRWHKWVPGAGGRSTKGQAMVQTHQSQHATRSMSSPTMANVAAAGGSGSHSQQVADSTKAGDDTQDLIVQAQVDVVFRQKVELQRENRELRHQLEAAKQRIKVPGDEATSLQVKELEMKLEQAKTKLKKASDHVRHHASHLTRMEEDLNLRAETIQRQEQEITRLHDGMAMIQHNYNIKLSDCRAGYGRELSLLQEQLKSMISKNSTLEGGLEECKERIFKLQPFDAKPDTEIASIYESFCDNITTWVGEIFDKLEDAGGVSIGMAAITANVELMGTQTPLLGAGVTALVNTHPMADEVMLSSFIVRFLHRSILHTDGLCFGLEADALSFLQGIMIGLGQLEPSKDPETIEMWRVDTYRALNVMQSVTNKQKELEDDCTIKLLGCLKAIAPGSIDKASRGACRRAVAEAISLAHEMRLTTASYRWASIDDPESGPKLLRGSELHKYKLMDIKTGQVLKRSAIKEHSEDMVIGEKFCAIFPALIRKGAKDGKEVILSKETILIHIHDGFRQQKQKRTQAGGCLRRDNPGVD